MSENKKENPLIAKQKNKSRIPGVVFRLPSLGVFYENTDILSEDVIDGEVLIYPMRLRDELHMKAVDAIFQGSAITDTISYCVPQVNRPEKMVSEDVDYLLTVIKKLTHGNTISYKQECLKKEQPESDSKTVAEEMALKELDDSAREETYNLKEKLESGEEFNIDLKAENESKREIIEIDNGICEFFIPIDHFIQNCKPLNPESIKEQLTFMFEEYEIESKPITFEEFKEISTIKLKNEKGMNNKEFADHVTNFSNANLRARIKRVDDIEDKEIINEWIETLTLKQRSEIFKKMEVGLKWGIDFEYEIECPKCGLKKKTDQSYLNPLYFFLM